MAGSPSIPQMSASVAAAGGVDMTREDAIGRLRAMAASYYMDEVVPEDKEALGVAVEALESPDLENLLRELIRRLPTSLVASDMGRRNQARRKTAGRPPIWVCCLSCRQEFKLAAFRRHCAQNLGRFPCSHN